MFHVERSPPGRSPSPVFHVEHPGREGPEVPRGTSRHCLGRDVMTLRGLYGRVFDGLVPARAARPPDGAAPSGLRGTGFGATCSRRRRGPEASVRGRVLMVALRRNLPAGWLRLPQAQTVASARSRIGRPSAGSSYLSRRCAAPAPVPLRPDGLGAFMGARTEPMDWAPAPVARSHKAWAPSTPQRRSHRGERRDHEMKTGLRPGADRFAGPSRGSSGSATARAARWCWRPG